VFDVLALKQRRGNAIFYRAKNNEFTHVLKRLTVIASATDPRAQVDRMWERLLEVALFQRTTQHRKPVDILKSFIRSSRQQKSSKTPGISLARMSGPELAKLTRVFRFIDNAHAGGLADSEFGTDQTHFYTLVTSLISSNLLATAAEEELIRKIVLFGKIISRKATKPKAFAKRIERYVALSLDRTTDSERRDARQKLFLEIVDGL
jgi:hypothetical protein